MKVTPKESTRRFESRRNDIIHFTQFREDTIVHTPISKGQWIQLRANVALFSVWLKPVTDSTEFAAKIFPKPDDTFRLLYARVCFDQEWVYTLEHRIYGKVEFGTTKAIDFYFQSVKKEY